LKYEIIFGVFVEQRVGVFLQLSHVWRSTGWYRKYWAALRAVWSY